jgi:hypothetical protein
MLISLGTLFAMQQAGMLRFRETWPLLLIVFGILKLIERVLLPRPVPRYYGYVPPQPGQPVPPRQPWDPPYGGVQQ